MASSLSQQDSALAAAIAFIQAVVADGRIQPGARSRFALVVDDAKRNRPGHISAYLQEILQIGTALETSVEEIAAAPDGPTRIEAESRQANHTQWLEKQLAMLEDR